MPVSARLLRWCWENDATCHGPIIQQLAAQQLETAWGLEDAEYRHGDWEQEYWEQRLRPEKRRTQLQLRLELRRQQQLHRQMQRQRGQRLPSCALMQLPRGRMQLLHAQKLLRCASSFKCCSAKCSSCCRGSDCCVAAGMVLGSMDFSLEVEAWSFVASSLLGCCDEQQPVEGA